MIKTLVCIGDSITRGTFTAANEEAPLSIATFNYPKLLKNLLKARDLHEYGVNGISYCSLSPVQSREALAKTCATFPAGNVTIVAAGTNDYGTSVPLGNFSDTEDISFYGAADLVFRTLKRLNEPNGNIFVLLPLPRRNEREKNGAGFVLADYRAALLKKAEKYSLFTINGAKLAVDPYDTSETSLIFDGTHPNEQGHRLLAEFLFREIENQLNSAKQS